MAHPEHGNLLPKLVRFPQELLDRIEEWRRRQPRIPSESEAIRRLVEIALEKEGVK